MKNQPFSAFKLNIILLASLGWLLPECRLLAQDTNTPKTVLEIFEAQTNVILVEGTELVGTVSADLVLTPQQFSQFQSLLQQAKTKLDSLRGGK